MAYIKYDKMNSRDPISMIILPYLHERRVYLNRESSEVGSFYTSVDTHHHDIKKHTLELARLCNFEEKKLG